MRKIKLNLPKLSALLIFFATFVVTQITFAMELSSPAFANNAMIPDQYTCKSDNISPALNWKDIPHHAQSLALVIDDPDSPSGTWTHWILYNLPTNITSLPKNAEQKIDPIKNNNQLPTGTQIGINSWQQKKYGGPCPPSGKHRYIFTLYALDTLINNEQEITRITLQKAMENHILAQATLTGMCQH